MAFDDKPKIEHKRDRKVVQEIEIPPAPPITPRVVTEDKYNELKDNLEGVLDKANRLYAAASGSAKKMSIPVHDQAPSVRAAVKRVDPESDGTQISFELYQKSLDEISAPLSHDQILEFAGAVTGLTEVDVTQTHLAGKRKKTPTDGIVDMATHMGILIAASQIMSGPSAMEVQKQTVEKDPPTSELPGIIGSWALTVAIMYALHAAEGGTLSDFGDDIMGDVKDTFQSQGLSYAGIEEEANKELSNMEKPQMTVKEVFSESDWTVVNGYSNEFLAHTDDPAYRDFIIASDVDAIRRDVNGSIQDIGRVWGPPIEGAAQLTDAFGFGMPEDAYLLVNCKAKGTNTALDMIAAAMYSKFGADMMCCLVRWLGAFDTKFLKQLRTWLMFLNRGLSVNLSDITKGLEKRFRNRLGKSLMEPIYHDIRKYFKKFGKEILDWMNKDSDKWDMLEACIPIDELVLHLLSALEHLEDLILDIFSGLWDNVQLGHVDWQMKIPALVDSYNMKQWIRILDAVIKAMDRGNLCVKDETSIYPSEDDTRRVADSVLNALPTPPHLEFTETGDPFRDFNPVTFTTEGGIKVPSVVESARMVTDIKQVTPEDCLKRLTDENIVPFVSMSEVQRNVQRIRKLVEETRKEE